MSSSIYSSLLPLKNSFASLLRLPKHLCLVLVWPLLWLPGGPFFLAEGATAADVQGEPAAGSEQASLQGFRDPETGAFRLPTSDEKAEPGAALRTLRTGRGSDGSRGLVERPGETRAGGARVDLGRGHRSLLSVRREDDGTLRPGCTSSSPPDRDEGARASRKPMADGNEGGKEAAADEAAAPEGEPHGH